MSKKWNWLNHIILKTFISPMFVFMKLMCLYLNKGEQPKWYANVRALRRDSLTWLIRTFRLKSLAKIVLLSIFLILYFESICWMVCSGILWVQFQILGYILLSQFMPWMRRFLTELLSYKFFKWKIKWICQIVFKSGR